MSIHEALANIVGKDYVSTEAEERYFYSRDAGLMPGHAPDYIVAPKTAEEVQKIVLLANEQKIPIVPAGAGMALTGLTVPHKGGIVIDMKRMRRILEVDEKARIVIVEGGTPQGVLHDYLDRNYPNLQHSLPESPPATTIASNVMIHGQGRLTQLYGFNSDMVSGLEVILPSGEIAKIGSCSISPDWFSKGATLPDLTGLFLGWFGATGIITKVGLKLYPRKKIRDVESFSTDLPDLMPEILYRLTQTGMVEDLMGGSQSGINFNPPMFEGYHYVNIYIAGDTDEEVEFKRRIMRNSLKEIRKNKDGGFFWVFPYMKPQMLETPQKWVTTVVADDKKGGGFAYSGVIAKIERYPELFRALKEVGTKNDVSWAGMIRVVDHGHSMMYGPGFPFNRADKGLMDRVRKALHEMSSLAMDIGAIPWKADIPEQKMTMERMNPGTLKLMKMIKQNLDPNGIMNPGNWEVQ
jgi:glycolate oxidase